MTCYPNEYFDYRSVYSLYIQNLHQFSSMHGSHLLKYIQYFSILGQFIYYQSLLYYESWSSYYNIEHVKEYYNILINFNTLLYFLALHCFIFICYSFFMLCNIKGYVDKCMLWRMREHEKPFQPLMQATCVHCQWAKFIGLLSLWKAVGWC